MRLSEALVDFRPDLEQIENKRLTRASRRGQEFIRPLHYGTHHLESGTDRDRGRQTSRLRREQPLTTICLVADLRLARSVGRQRSNGISMEL